MEHQLTDVYFRQTVCVLLPAVLCIILFCPLTCLTHFLETKSKIQLSWNLLLAHVVVFFLSDSHSSEMTAHFSVCIQRMEPVSVRLSWGSVAWYVPQFVRDITRTTNCWTSCTWGRKKLRADCGQEMLAIVRCRIFCLPGCYPKI